MQSINLLQKEQFSNKHSHAEPLHVDKNGRVILFTLEPSQAISEHNAPIIRSKYEGVFYGQN